MAGRLDRLLDPYQITPLFIYFPSLDTPALAPLPLTHYWDRVYVSVWHNSPSVASTGPIFEQRKIESFVTSTSRRDGFRRYLIKHVGMIENVPGNDY
jgi:hypothetical protein